ncbi:hypothetical protein D3C73_792830 [compost metagenome]
MAELAFRLSDTAANFRHQLGGNGAAFFSAEAFCNGAAEDRLAFGFTGKPLDRLVDDLERQQVAILGVIGPGEQAVAFQNHTLGGRVGLDESFEIQPELETGPAPGEPTNIAAENLLCQFLRVLRGRNCDDRIRVHVVDMRKRHETVQRRIDGCGARIEVESAMRQETDHAVFIFDTLIDALQRFQLVHIESGEAIKLDGADIAAGTLDPHDLDLTSGQRIGFHDLCGRVAAAVIGDAFVAAQKIGAIKQLARLIELGSVSIIPAVIEKADLARHVVLPDGIL